MSFVSLTDAEIAVDKPITQSLFQKIKDNFDALNGSSAGVVNGIGNGSAEIDTDADDVPDGWTASEYTGGTIGIYATAPEHGTYAFYMTHPGGAGNGGGTFTSDYVPCSDLQPINVKFIHWATAAGMKNQVRVLWYDEDKVALGTPSAIAYTSTANPTSAAVFSKSVAAQSGARYYRVQIVGGYTDTNVAGTAYFDGVESSQGIGYTAGSGGYIVGQMSANVSTASTSYTKCAEGVVPCDGTLYSSLYMSTDNNTTSYARIYVNGVATGTEHSTIASVTPQNKTDASISVARGDLLQIYIKAGSGVVVRVHSWVLRSTTGEQVSFGIEGIGVYL